MNLPTQGRFLEDIENNYIFGSDGEVPGLPVDENDVDANNDETFGADISPGKADELEDYAAQTASLRLDDDGWDRPGCSVAPDTSQIPLPDFDLSLPFGTSPLDTFLEQQSFTQTGLGSIWDSQPTPSMGGFSVWDTKVPSQGSIPPQKFPDTMDLLGNTPSVSAVGSHTSRLPNVPPMPKAPTLEELEGQANRSVRVPELPPHAVSAEELERRMLLEAASRHQNLSSSKVEETPSSKRVSDVPQMGEYGNGVQRFPQDVHNGSEMPPPPFPPLPPMLAQFVPVWMDLIVGRIQYLPHGCPPIPPFIGHLMNHFKDPRMVMSILMASTSAAQPPSPFKPFPPSNFGGYHRKAPGMPSGRTIEDLAFDQFAGYMSCKERQWLVKIQILQCQGNGNAYDEDFYYLSWRQKRLAEGWKPKPALPTNGDIKEVKEIHKVIRRNRDRGDRNSVSSSGQYEKELSVNDKFAGSLGVPSKSTTSNPRHLIRVDASSEVVEEEPEIKSGGGQKKLRTLLLRLESAMQLALECADRRTSTSVDISRRVDLIIREMLGEDLVKVIQIGKGRQLIGRLLRIAAPSDQSRILSSLFLGCSSLTKKVFAEIAADLVPAVYLELNVLNREKMIEVIATLSVDALCQSVLDKNTVNRDLLLNLILLCAQKKASYACPLLQWLKGPAGEMDWIKNWSTSIGSWSRMLSIRPDDLSLLAEWLNLLVVDFSQTTVASKLAAAIITIL